MTILSLFLTIVGLYIGFKQFKRRRNGRWSPYRGFRAVASLCRASCLAC